MPPIDHRFVNAISRVDKSTDERLNTESSLLRKICSIGKGTKARELRGEDIARLKRRRKNDGRLHP